VLWFLNYHISPTPTPSPTPTITPTPTPTITPTPTPTITPSPSPTTTVINSSYNVSIEKKVDGTRVDGDKVGIQYRVKVKNTGSNNLNNIQVRDTLPPDFTYDDNTTEGDLTRDPSNIEDVSSSDDNRRIIWNDVSVEAGKEINFGYRTTGKRTDTNFCNSAEARINDNIVATSQACTRIDQSGQTVVLAANTTKELPATGTNPIVFIGLILMAASGIGWKLSRHVE
jgi:uncharacterized repeat protein (TIGR01451 family)